MLACWYRTKSKLQSQIFTSEPSKPKSCRTYSKLTPAGSDGSTTGDEVRSEGDRLHGGSVRDEGGGLHQRHIVGQRVGVVARMVDDAGSAVRNAATVQEDSTDHRDGVGGGTADRAVSSRQHVAVVNDRATAEVRVAGGAQRHLVRELVRSSVLATNDTAGPFVVLGRQYCLGRRGTLMRTSIHFVGGDLFLLQTH